MTGLWNKISEPVQELGKIAHQLEQVVLSQMNGASQTKAKPSNAFGKIPNLFSYLTGSQSPNLRSIVAANSKEEWIAQNKILPPESWKAWESPAAYALFAGDLAFALGFSTPFLADWEGANAIYGRGFGSLMLGAAGWRASAALGHWTCAGVDQAGYWILCREGVGLLGGILAGVVASQFLEDGPSAFKIPMTTPPPLPPLPDPDRKNPVDPYGP